MIGRLFPKIAIFLLLISWMLTQPLTTSSRNLSTITAPQVRLDDHTADLAIGVYNEDTLDKMDSGATVVYYGAESGPYYYGSPRLFRQRNTSITDEAESGDKFGTSLTAGDFNGDTYQDLAIGVPLEDLWFGPDLEVDAGAVHVLYGDEIDGISTDDDVFIQQEYYGGTSSDNEYFGDALSAGDFNGDGYDDLAIGAPGEKVGSAGEAGNVTVVYGSSEGITTSSEVDVLHQDLSDVSDGAQGQDQFGIVLAVGDFNADNYDDLAVGVPFEDVEVDEGAYVEDAGAVNIFYGSIDGLSIKGTQFLHQNSPEVNDEVEKDDWFGWSLAAGKLNRDSYDDLIIGVPQETISAIHDGAVSVLFGFTDGIVTLGDDLWHQSEPGLLGDKGQDYDKFGWSVTAGDFDMDGYDDLAIGVPFEDFDEKEDAGVVHVLYSKGTGPTLVDNQLWHRDLDYMSTSAESHDHFGHALAAGDLTGDGYEELFVGVPGDKIDGKSGAGSVHIIHGKARSPTPNKDSIFDQNDTSVPPEPPETGDNFGNALAVLPPPPSYKVYLPLIFNN